MNQACLKQGKLPLKAQSGARIMRLENGEDEAVGRLACDKVLSSFPMFSDMSIDHATVRRIARLARLAVDDAHVDAVAAELDGVLRTADALQKADLDGVEPLAHPHEQALALREDTVTEPDRADAFLALAPESRGGLFLVPKVIE
jgi:aspartyl-tRNA(Asn)/glutamyl-tRNA(Gln) amidotransferase subunit C